jgi:1-acylglycerone phosphate reductase
MPGTVLITGCSEGGIGDAIAQEFFQRGYRVFATARQLNKVQHLKELGLDVLSLDVTSSSSIEEVVAHVHSETGGTLDVLVNNSGLGLQNL